MSECGIRRRETVPFVGFPLEVIKRFVGHAFSWEESRRVVWEYDEEWIVGRRCSRSRQQWLECRSVGLFSYLFCINCRENNSETFSIVCCSTFEVSSHTIMSVVTIICEYWGCESPFFLYLTFCTTIFWLCRCQCITYTSKNCLKFSQAPCVFYLLLTIILVARNKIPKTFWLYECIGIASEHKVCGCDSCYFLIMTHVYLLGVS